MRMLLSIPVIPSKAIVLNILSNSLTGIPSLKHQNQISAAENCDIPGTPKDIVGVRLKSLNLY